MSDAEGTRAFSARISSTSPERSDGIARARSIQRQPARFELLDGFAQLDAAWALSPHRRRSCAAQLRGDDAPQRFGRFTRPLRVGAESTHPPLPYTADEPEIAACGFDARESAPSHTGYARFACTD